MVELVFFSPPLRTGVAMTAMISLVAMAAAYVGFRCFLDVHKPLPLYGIPVWVAAAGLAAALIYAVAWVIWRHGPAPP